MEEENKKEETPETQDQTAGQDPNATKPADDQTKVPELPEKPVRITITAPGTDGTFTELELHIPTMVKAVSEAVDEAQVKIEIAQIGVKQGTAELKPGEKPELEVRWKTAFEGSKTDAIAQLNRQLIASENIPKEFYKFAQYVMDNSDLQAVSVCIACKDSEGKPAVAGFVHTAKHCTNESAVVLVNCMDANTQEFITKAGLVIPGRNAPKADGIIIPSADDKEKLGL